MITHLHVRSNYSLLYGANHVDEIVHASRVAGYRAVALTDINNFYGVHAFCDACRREGMRPIIGAEVRAGGHRAVMLARNRLGFSNISELLTRCRGGGEIVLPVLLRRYCRGTFMLSDAPPVLTALAGRVPGLYAMITGTSNTIPALAARLGLPLAASGEVSFVSAADRELHYVLRAIANTTVLSRLSPAECPAPRSYLLSPDEMAQRFANWPEALENTGRIGERCRFESLYRGPVFPPYSPLITTPSPGECIDAPELLRQRALAGVRRRYGRLSARIRSRLEYELEIIINKGFASYFLLVADIAALASRTCGRGSAAASLVSYALNITDVDPVRHDLYFDRFLNPERRDPPDIDIDFAWDERDAVVEEVRKRYGRERCAFVCNHVRFKHRSALRETARCYGIPDEEIAAVSSYLGRLRRVGNAAVPGAPPEMLEDPWPDICAIARRLVGFPRCLSVHVGGLVITPRPLFRYVPVETAPKGVPVITWEKDGTEAAGLVKIDLLCNRSLGVVRDALKNLHENGTSIHRERWNPIDDGPTRELLARGDSIGVFYVESPAMRQLQKKTGRGDFQHLVIHSSIIRPAANRYINEYVERLHGKPYQPLHPALGAMLQDTYGIMCYQEDVSKAVRVLAGFSADEGDQLRKILSKKRNAGLLADYRARFTAGARKRNVSDDVIDTVWNMIESFSGYSFCKPHSASYARISFQCAYLKAHFPAEFMAAVLSNGGGYYSASAYISEARRHGVLIAPPDVNRSRYRYHARDGQIIVGLMAISGMRQETGRGIERERRRNGAFSDLDDFMRRISLRQNEMEALVDVGALDSLTTGGTRTGQLWRLLLHRDREASAQKVLFDGNGPAIPAAARPRSRFQRLADEFSRLGFLCRHHPLILVRNDPASGALIARRRPVQAACLHRCRGTRRVTVVGWPITRKTISTVRGDPMEFVSFEDETAIYETVLFPGAYRRFSHLTDGGVRAMLVSGRVERAHGAVYLNVDKLTPLESVDTKRSGREVIGRLSSDVLMECAR